MNKDRESTLYVVLFCVLLIMGWVFLIYAPLREQKNHTQNMINRAQNRIETRAKMPDPPAVLPAKLERDLTELETERDALLDAFDDRDARFVDFRVIEELRKLRLEVAELATSAGLNVRRFGARINENEISDSAEALATQIREPWGRPVVTFEASGGYVEITDFVTRLGEMEKSAAILNMAILAPSFEEMVNDKLATKRLKLKLELAL